MAQIGTSAKTLPEFEPIMIGDTASRLSGFVFFTLCLIVVFSTIVFGAVDQASWVILSILTAGIVLFWIADAWFGSALLLNRDLILVPLLALIAIGVLQIIPIFSSDLPEGLAADPGRSAISLDPYATRLFVVRLIVYFVFLAAALTFVNSEKRLKRLVSLVVLFGALMAFFGILQRLANPDAIYGLRDTPQAIPFGPFVNQHHFASFMVMTAGVTLGFLFGRSVSRDRRLLLSIAAALMAIATLMTSSRGGLISFVGTTVFAGAASYVSGRRHGRRSTNENGGQRKFALVAAGTAILFLIVGSAVFLGGESSVIRGFGLAGGDDFTSGRSHFWGIALKIFAAHPAFGAGLDAFGSAFTRYDTWPGVYRIEQAHNDYLQTLADAGIAGFLAVAGFIYLLFRKGSERIAAANNGYMQCASIGALAGCFGILIHSFFDFPLRTPSNAFVFLMLTVIAVSQIKPSRLTNSDG